MAAVRLPSPLCAILMVRGVPDIFDSELTCFENELNRGDGHGGHAADRRLPDQEHHG